MTLIYVYNTISLTRHCSHNGLMPDNTWQTIHLFYVRHHYLQLYSCYSELMSESSISAVFSFSHCSIVY